MCYCDNDDWDILNDIRNGSIPTDVLIERCCWTRICRVRWRNYKHVPPETWVQICRERGYAFARANPRGF